MNLYDELGGEPAVNAAVDLFYQKLLADPRVAHFFDGLDMERQRAHQKAFLTVAFGGPNRYSGRQLRTAHAGLQHKGLSDSHVDVVLEHLGATLRELNVRDDLVARVIAVADSVRNEVLGR
jgi:hemoglobin